MKVMMSGAALSIVFLPLLILEAKAASDWVETEGGAMRVVAAPADPQGHVRGILEITLEPGWKTYWRDPGDGGIPPSLTNKADGAAIALAFPVPERIKEGDLNFLGYHAAVAFPFTIDADIKGVTLDAFVGICSDICVPFQAEFALEPLGRHASRIERAFQTLPAQAGEAERIVSARLADGVVAFETADAADRLFVAPDKGLVLGEPIKTATGFSAPVLRDDGVAAGLFFTLAGPDGAVSGDIALRR
jgi:DsbC/DsbD-like thiol-disulfide interchange protein